MDWQLILAIAGGIALVASLVTRWEQFLYLDWQSLSIFLLGLVGLAVGVALVVRYFTEYGDTAALWAALSLVGGLLLAIAGVELIIISDQWDR